MVVAPCFVLSLPIAHLFATRLMGDRRRRRGELLCVLDCSVISIPILGRFNAPRQTFFLLALLPYEGLKRLIEVVEEGAVAEVADMVGLLPLTSWKFASTFAASSSTLRWIHSSDFPREMAKALIASKPAHALSCSCVAFSSSGILLRVTHFFKKIVSFMFASDRMRWQKGTGQTAASCDLQSTNKPHLPQTSNALHYVCCGWRFQSKNV